MFIIYSVHHGVRKYLNYWFLLPLHVSLTEWFPIIKYNFRLDKGNLQKQKKHSFILFIFIFLYFFYLMDFFDVGSGNLIQENSTAWPALLSVNYSYWNFPSDRCNHHKESIGTYCNNQGLANPTPRSLMFWKISSNYEDLDQLVQMCLIGIEAKLCGIVVLQEQDWKPLP